MASFAGQRVLNKDPTVFPHGARPPPRYVSKYIEIKIGEFYINDIQFGDKTIQQLNCRIDFYGKLAEVPGVARDQM
jgi:hypothetical protein